MLSSPFPHLVLPHTLLPRCHHVIMGYNPFLPTAGARINTLCVPAGHVHPDRFQEFIKILRSASTVKLRVTDTSNRQRRLMRNFQFQWCYRY